jgi:hypothetical protein
MARCETEKKNGFKISVFIMQKKTILKIVNKYSLPCI